MYSTSSLDALDAAHALHHFGLELPEDAAHWVQRLTDLRSNRPQPMPHNAVATLIADDAEPEAVDKAIAAHLGHNHHLQQHVEAESISGQRALNAILAARDELHRHLANIAADTIARLHQAAQITDDIRELTRQRRT